LNLVSMNLDLASADQLLHNALAVKS
jgi:hypothetical protein